MVDLAPNSQLDLIRDRRRQLRQQRRLKLLQAGWRTLAIISLAGGLVWAATLPEWTIRQPKQVLIQGNQGLATETIRAFLPLAYPQFLLRLPLEEIAQTLESNTPVEKVTVTRQLFPPRLIVEVQERDPVAVVRCNRCILQPSGSNLPQLGPANLWLLDQQGTLIPLESYPALRKSGKVPKLSVGGLLRQPQPSSTPQTQGTPVVIDPQRQTQWPQIYQALTQSPVKISKIDWRDQNNMILVTDMGKVYLGSERAKLPRQLETLNQMRNLPKYVNQNQLIYINLKNPDRPLLKVKNTTLGATKK